MKKYHFIDSEESFKLGDLINLSVLVDKKLVNQLLAAGIIKEKKALSIEDIVNHLDRRIDCNVETLLENLEKANKKALFILLIKEAALVLDNKYEGHIKYSDELWGVSMASYEPFLMTQDPNLIMHTDFTKIAAFRCKEDVEEAIEVLKPLIDELK